MASEVLIKARITKNINTALATIRISFMLPSIPEKLRISSMAKTLSVKPTRYRAMLSAVPTKRVIPIAPPMGKPKLLESM